MITLKLRPAFVNALFLVTCLYYIYSTALVINIVIDNLQYVIISCIHLFSSVENENVIIILSPQC